MWFYATFATYLFRVFHILKLHPSLSFAFLKCWSCWSWFTFFFFSFQEKLGFKLRLLSVEGKNAGLENQLSKIENSKNQIEFKLKDLYPTLRRTGWNNWISNKHMTTIPTRIIYFDLIYEINNRADWLKFLVGFGLN